jgi:hypothetical protein
MLYLGHIYSPKRDKEVNVRRLQILGGFTVSSHVTHTFQQPVPLHILEIDSDIN